MEESDTNEDGSDHMIEDDNDDDDDDDDDEEDMHEGDELYALMRAMSENFDTVQPMEIDEFESLAARMREFSVTEMLLDDRTGPFVARTILSQSPCLEEFTLFDHSCGYETGTAIAESFTMIQPYSRLRVVNLAVNDFGDEASAAIVMSLLHYNSLESLELGSCGLGMQSAIALAHLLERNRFLKQLDVILNGDIGDDGGEVIAKSLKANTSLQSLHMTECNLGNKFSIALASSLKHNQVLKKIFINGNSNISIVGWDAIGDAMENNFSVISLGLSPDDFSRHQDKKAIFFVLLNTSNRDKFLRNSEENNPTTKDEYVLNMMETPPVRFEISEAMTISLFYYWLHSKPGLIF